MTGIIITLPDALAARAGTSTVLVCQDEDGFLAVFADYKPAADGYDVGARLRCFSPADDGHIAGIFASAQGLTVTDDAEAIRDADAKHAAQKHGGGKSKAKKRRRGVDRTVAPIGARYEDT